MGAERERERQGTGRRQAGRVKPQREVGVFFILIP